MTTATPVPDRCAWCTGSADYQHYHDHEWGFPVDDDRRLFEKVCLEGFQAGLSWITILRKREAFRAGFAQFRIEDVARFGEADIQRLLADPGIVRHRGKIEATINNARCALQLLEKENSLAAYFWRYEAAPGSRPALITPEWLRQQTTSAESIALSRDLKKKGWRFVGPTTMYALMQAMGLVNDHAQGCVIRSRALAARAAFTVPQ
ncbi:DNA-3-methyladenine glycosylase I [Silvimonas iriomotensis]|uniref:3-methyladenine DNA glycosylase n=1 Tax=Silvimonas iriomotensis TaxID=449662 RepID=A0ABQ2PDB2_9NEIS|nr:DNA-3-methyladenine glycosylase I [Silvimonas iriomotensis]GGP23145.1 3-methyladenine DNA glycosylase [Silvimonas iriomotensis]